MMKSGDIKRGVEKKMTTVEKVRQGEFKIARRDTDTTILQTENICTCTAFAGLNASKGIGFLAHFDTPCSTSLIKQMAADLDEHVNDYEGFEFQVISGLDGYWGPQNWPTKIMLYWMVFKQFGVHPRPQIGTWKVIPGRFGILVNVGVDVDDINIGIKKTGTYWWKKREYDRYKSLGKNQKKCPTCRGGGEVRTVSGEQMQNCLDCDGKGYITRSSC